MSSSRLPNQFPTPVSGEQQEMVQARIGDALATYRGDLNGILGTWPQPGPVLATVSISKASQQVVFLSLALSSFLSLCLSNK